jgi:hypothetical protein
MNSRRYEVVLSCDGVMRASISERETHLTRGYWKSLGEGCGVPKACLASELR